MRNKLKSEEGIQFGLRHIPDRKPPLDLKRRIMSNLQTQPESLIKRLKNRVAELFISPGRPGPVLVLASLVLVFFAGVQIDGFLEGPEPVAVSRNEPESIGPEMNADALFYLGRSLLASGQADRALEAFHRATLLEPENPQYTLWQGAAYYALGDIDAERKSYQQLIDSRPDFLPARLNLAHNFLQNGLVDQAKELYEQVLKHDPAEKSALYNRALALHLNDEKTAEIQAWKQFLNQYRTGVWAQRALRHLYENNDYTFRSYFIDYRSVILNQDLLLGSPGGEQEREIEYFVSRLKGGAPEVLHIVVFKQNDATKARQIARSLRSALVGKLPALNDKNIRISWFGEPETFETPDRKSVYLPEGVLIFSAPENKRKEERI